MSFRVVRFDRFSFFAAAIVASVCLVACEDSDGEARGGTVVRVDGADGGQPVGNGSPSCAKPAPLTPPGTTGPRFIVQLADTVLDAGDRIDAIQLKYGITATPLPNNAFVTELTQEQLAAMRCETDVVSIAEDTLSSPTG